MNHRMHPDGMQSNATEPVGDRKMGMPSTARWSGPRRHSRKTPGAPVSTGFVASLAKQVAVTAPAVPLLGGLPPRRRAGRARRRLLRPAAGGGDLARLLSRDLAEESSMAIVARFLKALGLALFLLWA